MEPHFPIDRLQKYAKSFCLATNPTSKSIKFLLLCAHIPEYFNQTIMFSTSAQVKSWMFKSSSELNKKREAANLKFVKERSKGMNEDSIKKFFLTAQEERVLYKHYESILHKFCLKFQPPMPKNVVGCSFQYFKRFYLNNSVMDYHPKDIVVTCVYLASKVEEFNVSISQFVANVKGDREKATEIILNHELLLMQQLNFDLAVYNPYRPVEGFLIDIKTRYTELFDPEHLRPAIEEFLDKIQFTDACFLYSPSQIALAAVAYGTAKFKESIDGYLSDILFDSQPNKLAYVRDAIKTMFVMLKNEALQVIDPVRAGLEKKLDKCRNQENNPSSAVYKRKHEVHDEDEDIEPAQKYSKLLENEESQMMEDEMKLGVQFLNHK
ncbi:cyclin-H [Trichonephila clavata]|uniref:Cyclin-H n=1 Tax=Trichonephila clavata TaxID=2740835 RepID=A0A8X6KQT8_TRICU|nr:cyclin-H [Trichonephila clavata]